MLPVGAGMRVPTTALVALVYDERASVRANAWRPRVPIPQDTGLEDDEAQNGPLELIQEVAFDLIGRRSDNCEIETVLRNVNRCIWTIGPYPDWADERAKRLWSPILGIKSLFVSLSVIDEQVLGVT
ncbi:hypothetical protein GNI_050850 [Gregarina niphandrodes]|uniref:Uncharacterized protein n=1 Tax=Gregarina niphandrodes TaxID=110365 RepID=A0A023B9H1_GRENI|nr:hypothetical protein GNI_050850 [Gregarina niphandrodes]EZG72700.1 hypothetical protein GNI_050850 [Gregarina niphandrodes]|eukprot:XP_011129758.1 hypothetical protein GNI_050850 [Gregarina niphandrodes]